MFSTVFSLPKALRRTHTAPLRTKLTALAGVLATGCALSAPPQSDEPAWCGDRCDEVVIDWNATAHQVIKAADGYANPLTASRALAMAHLAMHDAVNAVSPRYAAYASLPAGQGVAPTADAVVAAAAAAHDVLLALYPTQREMLQSMLAKSLHDAGRGASVEQGKALGAQAAAAVLAKRADDGSDGSEAYVPGDQPGEYRFVPGTNFVLMPHWRRVQPFALHAPSQFRVDAPPALDSAAYATAFEEVKYSGGQDSAVRTPDEAHAAAFWYEFSDSGWNRVARVVARGQRQNLWDRARLFALLNAAMADAYIAGWDSKMHHDFWRPVTAIREAASDGNPQTQPDIGWSSFLPTPPVQDHPSTHSALGAAAATVLAHGFGRDHIKFTVTSPTAPAQRPARSFTGFSAAAWDNADSRVRAGLHFRFATVQGLMLGTRIGQHAVATLLQAAR